MMKYNVEEDDQAQVKEAGEGRPRTKEPRIETDDQLMREQPTMASVLRKRRPVRA